MLHGHVQPRNHRHYLAAPLQFLHYSQLDTNVFLYVSVWLDNGLHHAVLDGSWLPAVLR